MHLYLCCRIEAGSTEVELEDWDTGLMVTLPLDRFITVAANADQIYKKARKQRRAAENIIPLLATAEHQVICLQYIIIQINSRVLFKVFLITTLELHIFLMLKLLSEHYLSL